jgi:signal transduction histidine kinase
MEVKQQEAVGTASSAVPAEVELRQLRQAYLHVLEEKQALEMRVHKGEKWRQALLHILQDLQQSNLRLENGRKAMIHIMGDLKETEETLQVRTRELVEASAAKDVFLGMASHELRTPLTVLKGLAQFLHRRLERERSAELAPLVKMERAISAWNCS